MFRRLLLLSALLVALLAPSARALGPDDVVRVELLRGWRTADGRHMAGLRIDLAPGWKTYWRAPGEAGVPPRLSVAGSGNVAGARVHWPVPDVFEAFGLRVIGYADEVVLPVELRPSDPAAPLELRLRLDFGVCKEICMPVSRTVAAPLPQAGAPDAAVLAALRDRPVEARSVGLQRVSCRMEPGEDGLRLAVELQMPALGADETVVLEAPGADALVSAARTERQGRTLRATAEVRRAGRGGVVLDRSAIRITVLAEGRAAEVRGCRRP